MTGRTLAIAAFLSVAGIELSAQEVLMNSAETIGIAVNNNSRSYASVGLAYYIR